jgi:hypothetical protein
VFTNAAGSSITAKWYEDDNNGLSTVTGTAGSAPIVSVAGSQVGSTFTFAAPDNINDALATPRPASVWPSRMTIR